MRRDAFQSIHPELRSIVNEVSVESMREKAYIQTYGCQMNEHDSQRMMEVLQHSGFDMTEEPTEAAVILVNTCSVRHNPENKVYSLLGRLRRLTLGHFGREHQRLHAEPKRVPEDGQAAQERRLADPARVEVDG